MAIAKLADGIDELHGALDSVKDGKRKRARLVCRWRPQGPQSYAPDGSKLHELFYMRFPEGPRSEGYQRNFNMILAAQRMAHDIERSSPHLAGQVRGLPENHSERKHVLQAFLRMDVL